MAADRGRDLKFSILSDSTRFDVDPVAQGLQDMARSASDAARDLDRLDRDARGLDLDRVGDDARAAARQVDTAFDTIARASRTSATKVDASTDKMRDDLDGVKEEAGQTAREMGASFSAAGDIGDAFQELAAQAGQYFGPIGTALGVAAAVGVGLFREQTEKLKEQVGEIVDAIIDGGGRIDEAFVNVKLAEFAKDGELAKIERLVELYNLAGISYRDVARAKAGDAEASARVTEALQAETDRRKSTTEELTRSEAAVAAITDMIGAEQEAMRLAQAAAADYGEASLDATTTAKEAVSQASSAWDDLKATYGEDVVGTVRLEGSQVLRDAQLAWLKADAYFRRNPITIRTAYQRSGLRPVRDVP